MIRAMLFLSICVLVGYFYGTYPRPERTLVQFQYSGDLERNMHSVWCDGQEYILAIPEWEGPDDKAGAYYERFGKCFCEAIISK